MSIDPQEIMTECLLNVVVSLYPNDFVDIGKIKFVWSKNSKFGELQTNIALLLAK